MLIIKIKYNLLNYTHLYLKTIYDNHISTNTNFSKWIYIIIFFLFAKQLVVIPQKQNILSFALNNKLMLYTAYQNILNSWRMHNFLTISLEMVCTSFYFDNRPVKYLAIIDRPISAKYINLFTNEFEIILVRNIYICSQIKLK